jgi:hypothetical protein
VDTLQTVGDFVELYLSPYQSSKNIEFVQLKIHRKAQRILRRTNDALLLKVACFQDSLTHLKKYRRSSPYHKQLLLNSPEEKFYHGLTQLNPEDCLIMIAAERYQMTSAELSLILKRSSESIEFRRNQLKQTFAEESIPFVDPTQLKPKDLIIQLTSASPERIHRSVYQSFQSLPFAIRFTVETLSVLFTLVFLMWVIPEIRNTYENSVQKRINDYLIESSLVDSPAPEGTSKTAKVVPSPDPQTDSEPENEPNNTASAASKKQPKVNDGETWRFSFTGAMTNELEAGILSILKKQGLEEHKPLTVPGGIQFDFTLRVQDVISLKTSLEDMTSSVQQKTSATRQNMMSSANMSWYKRRMQGRKIPSGNVQVIIWISTL